ncbi:MAG: ArsR/SmtB family transcription factor [Phycisphaerae bacterium]
MREFLNITKALSDENRIRAMMALAGGELCVCQLIELLELAPSTVSKHMSILHQAGLVETRKDGRWIYYRPSDAPRTTPAGAMLATAQKCLADDATIREDARRLKRIRKISRDALCVHYHDTKGTK